MKSLIFHFDFDLKESRIVEEAARRENESRRGHRVCLDTQPQKREKYGEYIHGGGGLFAKLCPTLCNPLDCSLPASSVHGILQARILEWIAMPSSGDLPDPGIEPASLILLHWQVGSSPLAAPGKPSPRVINMSSFLNLDSFFIFYFALCVFHSC